MKVELMNIEKLVPYARNPRITAHAVDKVAASIKEYGFRQPIVVDSEMVIVVGHVRYQAAQKLGIKKVPVHVAEGLTKEQIKAYASLKIDGGPENEPIIRKIRDGIIRNVSVGYRVHRYEVIRNDGAVPLYRAIDWEPYEISLVPIGADAGAGIRSTPHTYPCEVINLSTPKEKRTMSNHDTQPNENPATPETPAANPPADAPENPATPANPATPEPEGAEEARAEGMRLERSRVLEVSKIVRAAKLPDIFAQKLINEGTPLQQARKLVLDELARKSGEGGEIRSQVLKYYPSGAIAGFDIPTIVSMTHALGYDSQAVLRLLEHAEQGLREAVKKHGDSNTEHIDSDRGS
jgi:hypothetical protein